jgi:hypothetical protein
MARTTPAWLAPVLSTVLGAAIGGFFGFFLTIAVFVGKARAGYYVFSLDDVTAFRWEMIPTWLAVVGAAWLAAQSLRSLGSVVGRGLVGAAVGWPVGWVVGPLLWTERSAPWAGAVLATAFGLIAGAAWGARVIMRRSGEGAPASDDPDPPVDETKTKKTTREEEVTAT